VHRQIVLQTITGVPIEGGSGQTYLVHDARMGPTVFATLLRLRCYGYVYRDPSDGGGYMLII